MHVGEPWPAGGSPVMPECTEVVWTYRPADFFEVPYRHQDTEFDLLIGEGKAVAILRVAQDPVEARLEDGIRKLVESVCGIRQLQVRRKYDVEGPTIYQYAGGRQDVAIRVGTGHIQMFTHRVDIILRDAAGNVVRDSKSERAAENTSTLDLLAPKIAHSPSLRSAVASYSRSISDPSNELVHLYEVRDALKEHYGGEDNATRRALNISETEWKRLGILANAEPLEQGRHRGKHAAGRRSATESELQEAREIVRRWIIAFGRSCDS